MLLGSYKSDSIENETREFLRLLYHDRRGGQMIRLIKSGDTVNSLSTCDEEELAATGTDMAHVYTSVNTFRGSKRSADKLYCYCSIFIDLDCHTKNREEIIDAKRRTADLLEAAYVSGKLAIPTMVTDTGRGFGIQYVLKKSIANGNNAAQREFFKKVREGIYRKYKELMDTDPMAASADPTVLDDSRVVRLPGTFNVNADTYCHLIMAQERYYELSELVQGCHLWDWKEKADYKKEKTKREKKKKERKIIPFRGNYIPFLTNRIEQLKTLQKIRGQACTDCCREQMLFILYSALKQVNGQSAGLELQLFNNDFTHPLGQKELNHIIEETNADPKGFYKLPDAYVIRTLNITEEEISVLGFGSGWRRTAAKRETAKKRKEIRNKVIGLLGQVDRLTYTDIAEQIGISRRTVCTIAKEVGISRYKKNVQVYDVGKRPKNEVETSHDMEQDKSAKTYIESVCVVSSDAPQELLSTSLALYSLSDIIARLHVMPPSLISQQLLRVAEECFSIAELRDTAQYQLSLSLPQYEHLTYTELLKLQLKDLQMLAMLRVTVQEEHANEPEISDQRETRINSYLAKYSDDRFKVLEGCSEYSEQLDPAVLKSVKIAFMQMIRVKRDYFMVQGRKIPATEIKKCFESCSYKDIAVICQRIASKGTILHAQKPFFYIMQTIWNYKHINSNKFGPEKKDLHHRLEERTDTDFKKLEADLERLMLKR